MTDQRIWYLWTGEGQKGPCTIQELLAWKYEGKITDDWYAWREGFSDWKRIAEIPELSTSERIFQSTPQSEEVPKGIKGLGFSEKTYQQEKEAEHKTEGVPYCGQCGGQNPQTSKFCNQCGSLMGSVRTSLITSPHPTVQDTPVGTWMELIVAFLIILIIAAVITPLFNREFSRYGSPEKTFKIFFKATKLGNMDELFDCMDLSGISNFVEEGKIKEFMKFHTEDWQGFMDKAKQVTQYKIVSEEDVGPNAKLVTIAFLRLGIEETGQWLFVKKQGNGDPTARLTPLDVYVF